MQIKTKQEFYELWNSNKLGNKLRTWNTLEDLKKNGYTGLLGIRAVLVGGGPFLHGFTATGVPDAYKQFKKLGVEKEDTVLCEAAPDEKVTLQGEVYRDVDGLYLFALENNLQGLRMRDALKLAREYHGLEALILLKKHLSAASYDDIMELFDLYPDSVIEFSAYSNCLGWAQGRNTLIWEVRNY
jgi:hypothetical protein